jgi:hypothetical protein
MDTGSSAMSVGAREEQIRPLVVMATPAELAAHEAVLSHYEKIGKKRQLFRDAP